MSVYSLFVWDRTYKCGACTLTIIEAVIPFEINIAIVGRPAGSELTARFDILVGGAAAINLRIYLHCSGV